MMFLLVGDIPTGNCKLKRGCLESLAIGTSNVGGQPIAGESRQPPAAFHPRISERQVKSETHEGDKVQLSTDSTLANALNA
jgi:hypothetical protein